MLPIDLQLLSSFTSTRLIEGNVLYTDMDHNIMGKSYVESIGQNEVQRFLEKQEIEASHIGIYVKYDTYSMFNINLYDTYSLFNINCYYNDHNTYDLHK